MYSSPCTCYNEFSSAGSDVLGFSFRRASGLLLMFLWGDRGKQLTFARHARNDSILIRTALNELTNRDQTRHRGRRIEP